MGWTIVTGATGSMGSVAVETLAKEGRSVILACRNMAKGSELLSRIKASVPGAVMELKELDMASQASVRDFVKSLEGMEIEALFNNAGTMERHYGVTVDGLEKTVAVNYLNLALLCMLLAPVMKNGGHIVNMVSISTKIAHAGIGWTERGKEQFSQIGTYAMSKLLLLNYSVALARHCPDLHVNVSDPGIVNSKMIHMDRWFDPLADIFFRPFISSPAKGVSPALRALHADASLRYYVGKGDRPIASKYLDSELPEQLWQQARKMLGME